MMLDVVKRLYHIEVVRHGHFSIEINAEDRLGNLYTCHVSRHPVEQGYWLGCSDFGGSDKLTFGGLMFDFIEQLRLHSRESDPAFYAYICYRNIGGWMSWKEAKRLSRGSMSVEDGDLDFKGSINYYTIHR